MEPILAQVFGWIFGVDYFPGVPTLLAVGCFTYGLYKINSRDSEPSEQMLPSAAGDQDFEHEEDEVKLQEHLREMQEKVNIL